MSECTAGIEVALAVGHIVMIEKNLCCVAIKAHKAAFIGLNQAHLPHGSGSL